MTLQLSHVLYIEDDRHLRSLVALTLEEHGLSVATAGDWRQALASVSQQKPDLLLIDVMLPEKDGVETLRALREVPTMATVPAIFLTVDVSLSSVTDRENLGPYEVIAKPFQVNRLHSSITAKWSRLIARTASE